MKDPIRRIVKGVSEQWADEGRIVEAGWSALRQIAIPPDAPREQVEDMRKVFFAGAQHLWGSVLTVLSPDAEPTMQDIKRMELIDRELREFYETMRREHGFGGQ